MPELAFKGKEFVYNHHLSVPFRPLVPHPEKGVEEARLDGNLIIHGDNLHALKALLPMYAGKVDCIYIDPPYNTGQQAWRYNDDVNAPQIQQWLRENPVNVDDMLRHDKWLCMMWPRLVLLRELLSDTGTLWVSIDNGEVHRLRAVLDEIFGEKNFLAEFVWKSRVSEDARAKTGVSDDHEYVLCYRKSEEVRLRGAEKDLDKFSNPDADERGPWRSADLTGLATREQRPNLHFDLINPDTGVNYGCPPKGWRYEPSAMQQKISEGRILWPEESAGRPRHKLFLSEIRSLYKNASSVLDFTSTADGTRELNQIMGAGEFDFPKPVKLVDFVLTQAADDTAVVLDSFAGSGTTAHAVFAANSRDEGDRRFILVEMEDYADKLTAERVRRVIHGYPFQGKQREEFLRERITWTRLRSASALLEQVEALKNLHGPSFDRIKKIVTDGELVVTGEKDVRERIEGLGGSFTYCTLGDPIDMDKLLTGESLPSFEALAGVLFHTATNTPLDASSIDLEGLDGHGHGYLGEAAGMHVWLIYQPDLEFLKSRDAALTLAKARTIAEAKEGRHLVFAPARFVSQKLLNDEGLPVEFAPLPFALYRVEKE